MKKLGLIVMLLTLSGCASVGVIPIGSNTLNPLPEGSPVYVYSSEQDIKAPFKVIGLVSYTNPGKYQILSLADIISDLKEEALNAGANGLIIDETHNIKSGIISTGIGVTGRAIFVEQYSPSIAVPTRNIKADLDNTTNKVLLNDRATSDQRVEEKRVLTREPVKPNLSGTAAVTPYPNAPSSGLPDVKPDLSGATTEEQRAIERACDTAREAMAKQFYYECLSHELAKLRYR
jgi:hypothetical protein